MDGLRYRQGPGADWLVLVRGTKVVLLPAETSQQRVDDVWTSLQGSPSLEDVFDAVTGGLAGSLSRLPSFGLVSVDGQVNVLLRGELELELDGAPAASGRNLRTWSEQVFPASGTLVLRSLATAGPVSAPLLFLRDGMAAVLAIEIDLDAVPEAAAVPAAAVPAAAVPEAAAVPAAAAPPDPAGLPVPSEPPAAPAPGTFVPEAPAESAAEPLAAPSEPAGELAEPAGESAEPAGESAEPAAVPGPDLSAAIPWLNLTPPPLSPETALAEEEDPHRVSDGGEPTETLPPVDHDGHTVMGFRPQPGTALPGTPLPEAPAPAPTVPDAGPEDDDGETIRSAPAVPAPGASSTGSRPGTDTGPTVLARTCPQGHINPPTAAACRFCGAEMSGEPRPVSRPSLGLMRLSTGAVYELDRNIVIGRQPSASRVAGAALPRMVQVPSDSGDISRSHAEVRLEGWHVMLRDLFSTNGTVLIREGSLPRRLAQGEAAILLDGDIAELGDGVTLRFEGLA